MNEGFSFDVFLSHSSKDRDVVRQVAQRLSIDGIKVWFDQWMLKPGDCIPEIVEEGLERSRVLVLCISTNMLGSEWSELESRTFRFRDPLNAERRFVPLRLDDVEIKGSLAQFLYVDWRSGGREEEYSKLVETCRPVIKTMPSRTGLRRADRAVRLDHGATVYSYSFSGDGKRVLTGSNDNNVRLWQVGTAHCVRVFKGHTNMIWSVVLSSNGHHALSGSKDGTVRFWNIETGECLRVLQANASAIFSVALSEDEQTALSGDADGTLRLWDLRSGECLKSLEAHRNANIWSLASSADLHLALSSDAKATVRLWDVSSGRCIHTLKSDIGTMSYTVAFSPDQRFCLSGSDHTMQLWDLHSGRCLRVLEGHRGVVRTTAWSSAHPLVISGSYDNTIRLWDVKKGTCRGVLEDHNAGLRTVAWSSDGRHAFSGDGDGDVRVWDLSEFISNGSDLTDLLEEVQYTNAKVVLVGESGSGKTGLSKRLALDEWEPSDSTVGAWATQWKLPVSTGGSVEREIWLWDFGGQADQRLIHQLYIDETALAVLVFDGQKEDLFDRLEQWDRDLTRAATRGFSKLLVAGRVDAGGLRASRTDIQRFAVDRKFRGFLETSAKQNLGCEQLKNAIIEAINWDELPCRTTEIIFKRLKEEIIRLRDEGRVLMRFNELREALRLRLSGDHKRFPDDDLRVVLTLLAGPGAVWELKFGSWVLLQPERINAYAQALIRTLQADEHQRGCLPERRVLDGDLIYESSMERLTRDDERFILLAVHQTLVERGLCLRQPTEQGNLLVFPSYYRREREELERFPAVLVNYRVTGFLDEIYATLVVRLHHTDAFNQDHLWRYAADFRTLGGKRLGFKLTRRAPGVGDLEVYFDPSIAIEEKILFAKYIHEHLSQHAHEVERFRHYVCQNCGTPVGNREIAMKRLNTWLQGRPPKANIGSFKLSKVKREMPTILCVECEKKIPLWDDMEQRFASPAVQERVREMQEESAIVLSNQSKERALVGEVISTVALANQISREFNVSDHGIDMEIEFTDDDNKATGAKLYLQLKSGDSYLRERKRDGVQVFTIKDARHVEYWMAQAFPVLLVVRDSAGDVRWMEVREWLKQASSKTKDRVTQIAFEGERFDVMSVRRWRERALSLSGEVGS